MGNVITTNFNDSLSGVSFFTSVYLVTQSASASGIAFNPFNNITSRCVLFNADPTQKAGSAIPFTTTSLISTCPNNSSYYSQWLTQFRNTTELSIFRVA